MASTEPKRTKRRRRSAEEARREILDVAERKLSEVGPEGLKLQEIARAVGISHPAVLHHFGSREGLVQAVVARAIDGLTAELVMLLRAPEDEGADIEEIVERVFTTLVENGQARLLAWLLLSGRDIGLRKGLIRGVAETAHVRLIESGQLPKGREVHFEDMLFTVVMIASVSLGTGVGGGELLRAVGSEGDAGFHRRFRLWLAQLVRGYLIDSHAAAATPRASEER